MFILVEGTSKDFIEEANDGLLNCGDEAHQDRELADKTEEGSFEQGVKQGKWTHFFHTGQFWRNVTYLNGQLQTKDALKCQKLGGQWIIDFKERLEQCFHNEQPAIALLTFFHHPRPLIFPS